MTTAAAVAARWPHARGLADLPRGRNGAILYPRKCEMCGADFGARKSKPGKFCSKRCRNRNNGTITKNLSETKYHAGPEHPHWRGGKEATRARQAEAYHTSPAIRTARRAHAAVRNALLAGRLSRGPCITCGAEKRVEAHHHDYAKPLDVTWFCRKHHIEHENRGAHTARRLMGIPAKRPLS